MTALAFVASILPGKQEAWRRFYQALEGSRRHQYEELHKRLRITKELVWLIEMPQGDVAVAYLEADDPELMISNLAASNLPFDCWFKEQLLILYGLDVEKHESKHLNELAFVWSEPS